tara:strand:+ start:61 stop:504 length:444 start_codon:yes stop_codon:yes gene_type:complete
LSTFLSVILTISTFPLGYFSPDWIFLIIIYWIIAVPNMYNFFVIWLIGIITDVAVGSTLGMNALIYVFLLFIVKKLYKSLRYFTVIQQGIIVLVLMILKITFLLWIDAMLITDMYSVSMYWTTLTSALVWPIIFFSLRHLRRRYNIT